MQNADNQTVPLAEHQRVVNEYQRLVSEAQALKARVAWFERQLFGRKTERFVPKEAPDSQLQLALNEAELSPEKAETVKQFIAAHERQVVVEKEKAKPTGRQAIPEHLPRVEEVLEPEEDTTDLTYLGEDVTEILEYTPPQLWVRRIRRPRYVRNANAPARTEDGEDTMIVQAPAPEHALGRLKAGVSLVSSILLAKYVEHLPLHRLIARFARMGIKIPPATLGDWVKAGVQPLQILYEAYQKLLFSAFYLQMDETTLKVLEDGKGKAHLGYLWAVYDPVRRLPFFFYQTGRDHKGVKKRLEHFAGILQCDGYSVYETLRERHENIMLVNCMAHIRRKFFDAKAQDEARAKAALIFIGKLYNVEAEARQQQLDAQSRLQLREEKAAAVVNLFFDWARAEYTKVLPKSAIGEALHYALKREQNMRLYLADGRLEIDNNLVENIIRPPAIGRKNYLFAGSHEAAQRSAILYTFFAACKQHQIDPEKWLIDVLNRIQDTKLSALESLMPHRWRQQDNKIGE